MLGFADVYWYVSEKKGGTLNVDYIIAFKYVYEPVCSPSKCAHNGC